MLDVSVNRGDLTDQYGDWINRALKAIQADNSYNCMRHSTDVEIAGSESSVKLPADFKEFVPDIGGISVVDALATSRGRMPCDLVTEEKLIRTRAASGLPSSVWGNGLQVFATTDGDNTFLNILDIASGTLTFTIKYFRYLPSLAADTDQNFLTRTYEDMVQARVKAVAFSLINDPLEAAELTKYEIHRKKAVIHDARIRAIGRINRMGG